MKAIFILLFLSIIIASASAQDWVHHGSKWHYSWLYFNSSGYTEYKYVADTAVENHSCHMLSLTEFSSTNIGPSHYTLDTITGYPIYTYSHADTCFFYYRGQLAWQAVYFFGGHVGDSIVVPNAPTWTTTDTFVHAIIDTVGTTIIDTFHLRYYKFHLTDSCQMGWYGKGTVIERVGMQENDLLPFWHCVTDDYYYQFCSYKDDSFALYKPYPDCDNLPTAIEETSIPTFKCSPNPAQNELNINMSDMSPDLVLFIRDINGKELMRTKLETKNARISTSSLANGV